MRTLTRPTAPVCATAGLSALACLSASALAQSGEGVAGMSPLDLGLTLVVLGMGAVFMGLTGIYGFLLLLRRLVNRESVRSPLGVEPAGAPVEITAEMAHAIALALYMDLRTFDEGRGGAVTIRKITRPFSPWVNAGRTQLQVDKSNVFRGRDRM
jgi:Na+-transporting methylmalonyl-CoA/oxaloacetate decarboxylase gamma subunit